MSQNEQGGSAQLSEEAAEDLIFRIGKLTRMLRDNMRELGLDKEIEKAAEAIPDARDRLHYVATMTEQAADRALNAIDRAQPLQDQLSERAEALDKRWAEWFEAPKELDDAKVLVKETRTYLSDVPEITSATNKELMDIMMAQDFQDLTGQVIKKMMDVIREIEHQLVQVLIDNVPGVGHPLNNDIYRVTGNSVRVKILPTLRGAAGQLLDDSAVKPLTEQQTP